jgi:FkbM family methyltransferase
LKLSLERRGWFLRRTRGLTVGTDLCLDLKTRLGMTAPKVIFDVGAHRGETAVTLNAHFPAATIFAFEPVSENFAGLQEAVGAMPNVRVFRSALGDRSEHVDIVLQEESQTHSLNIRSHEPNQRTERIRVETLDAFVAQHAVPYIDLLKIDTEGYEVAVLRGAADALRSGRIGAVFVEASLDPADTVHTQLQAVSEYLRPLNFHLFGFYDQTVWPAPTRLAYFNALFTSAVVRQR